MVRGQGTCGISKAKPKDQWNGKPLPEREDWEIGFIGKSEEEENESEAYEESDEFN